jgi:hypothetical protein
MSTLLRRRDLFPGGCVESWKKGAIGFTLVGVVAIGGELLYLHHRNNEEAPVKKVSQEAYKLTDDDMVMFNLKKLRPDSLKDARELIGKTLWMSAGDQFEYYKDTGKHVDYAHPVAVLQGGEPLIIKDVFEQVPPHNLPRAVARVDPGQRHVLLAFTLPKSADPKALYAMPTGHYDGGVYEFVNDQIFFYDDPHELFKSWGPEAWAHVDKHEVVPGMTEHQALIAYGEVLRWSSDTEGDRTIRYENNGHPMKIVFEHGKATSVTPEDSY